jgi:hypothetical protein
MYQLEMNVELSSVLLTVAGTLLVTLGGALWWIIQKFTESVKELKDTVSDIKVILSVVEERVLGIRKDVDRTNTDMSSRIACAEEDLYRIDETVSILKSEIAVLKALENEHHSVK